jgi:hypothetical protein
MKDIFCYQELYQIIIKNKIKLDFPNTEAVLQLFLSVTFTKRWDNFCSWKEYVSCNWFIEEL